MTIGVNLGRQLVSSSSKNFAAKSSQYFGQLKYIYLSIKLYFPLHISEYYIFHISYPSIFMPTLGSLHRVRLRTQSNPLPCPPQHSLCSDSGPPKVYAYVRGLQCSLLFFSDVNEATKVQDSSCRYE